MLVVGCGSGSTPARGTGDVAEPGDASDADVAVVDTSGDHDVVATDVADVGTTDTVDVVAPSDAADTGAPWIDPADALPPVPTTHRCRLFVLVESGDVPERLSDTGCVVDGEPAPEFVPYELNAPLWTDGADKARFVSVPPGARIAVRDDGTWSFPIGSVLMKVFSGPDDSDRAGQRVETRFMVRSTTGWSYLTFVWDDGGSDAERVTDGGTVDLTIADASLPYVVPSEAQCAYCHAVTAEEVLGPRTGQLDRVVEYASGRASQLDVLVALGLLDRQGSAPRWPEPFDPDDDLESRARAWLAANCGHCHQPGGWRPPELTLDLRFETSLADTRTCDERVQYLSHLPGDVRIAPGDPDASNLWLRIAEHGVGRMPSLATSRPDEQWILLVRDWILSMDGCP